MKFGLVIATALLLSGTHAAPAVSDAPPRSVTDACLVLTAQMADAGAEATAAHAVTRACIGHDGGTYRSADGSGWSDRYVCPVLMAMAGPHAGGMIYIFPDGDVFVYGVGIVWECPPYTP